MTKLRLLCGAALALVASSCGVAADDVAATYRDSEISTDTVDALANDEAFSQLTGFPVGTQTSVVSGTSARGVLDFLLQGVALIDEAQRQGLDTEPDEALLAETVASLQQQGYAYSMEELGEQARDFLAGFVAADRSLASSGADLGSPTEEDLRFVYAETADSGRWDRTCVTMVAGLERDAQAMADAVSDGAEPIEIPESVPDAQVALDPAEACATSADLAQMPEELATGIGAAEVGVLVGPVAVDQEGGPSLVVFFEVESVEVVDFEAARGELEAEVAQSLMAVRIARETEVNPRYGDGVDLEPATSQTGQVALVARVQRPAAPETVPDFAIQGP